MQFIYSLLIAAVFFGIAASWPVVASNVVDTTAPAQPFVHPSDDRSYDEDVRDDETQAKPAQSGNIDYISGGVSDGGMDAIDAEKNAYNLKMLFVAAQGEYLAKVNVNIADAKGNDVLNATTQGPVLFVKMPAGRYTVTAKTDDGSTVTRRVQVRGDHLASYVLRYPTTE